MKIPLPPPSRFSQRSVATMLLTGGCLVAAISTFAQKTDSPAGDSPDNDVQSKARAALHQTEKDLDAGKTNTVAVTTSKPGQVVTATNAPPTRTTESSVAKSSNASAKPAETAAPETDGEDLNNWVELGVGGSIVNGDKAQYQRQSGLPANTAFGGIKSLHYETLLGKKGLFSIDGRGIFDNHDYDLKLEVQHPDKGYVVAGFRQFREYYDGSGGYLPLTGTFFALPDNRLALDRGATYIEAALTLPDMPVFKLRLEHDYRTGDKDSTEWGTTTLTPGAVQKKVTPAFRHLDEKTDFIAFDITHNLWDTDFGLGMRYDWIRNNDSQNVLFMPNQGTATHTLTQTDANSSDMFNVHAFTDSHLSQKLELSTGWSYTSMTEKIFGNRLDTPATTTAADTRYANLAGGEDFAQYEMDANVMITPCENVFLVPAFRIEKEDTSGSSSDNTVTGNNVIGAFNGFRNTEARLDICESLDARYTGVTNWVFYVRGELGQNRDDLGLTTLPTTQITSLLHERIQKYTGGINWYPLSGLNFSAQYYHKIDDNDYENTTAAPTAYPGFISRENFFVDDANFRVTWRPLLQLTLVTRYDYQRSTIDMTGFGLGEVQSGNNTTHQIGETISWSPFTRLYFQLAGNYVLDHTHTPAETQTVPSGIVQESKNDYWTANGTVGLALDNKSQLRLSYSYYRAADYSDNTAITGLPYGAGGEQHAVSASIDRQITKRMSCNLKYNFTSYRDQLFHGNLDYTAHTILSSIQYRF